MRDSPKFAGAVFAIGGNLLTALILLADPLRSVVNFMSTRQLLAGLASILLSFVGAILLLLVRDRPLDEDDYYDYDNMA